MNRGILGSRGNELIAEFMGLSIKEGVSYYTDENDCFPMGIEVEEPYLQYHTSWDWLMPVIEKIEQHHKGVPIQMINMSLYSRINEVYFAVIDYITEARTCESCCYNIVDDNGDVMEHECIND